MFTVYYSNQVENHKGLLISILQRDPNPDPFAHETVLVQSLGMAQWLQLQIAEQLGVSGNVQFPYPTSFLWQQYRLLFPELPKENIFERNAMVWRLMRLIPEHLAEPAFLPLANYLAQPDQLKLYQLASKIADLFDQYLVYRPYWLVHWEKGELTSVLNEIKQHISFQIKDLNEIEQNMQWQSLLWNALVADLRQDSDELIFNTSHRAYLQQRYFEKLDNLTEYEQAKLPKRIFVFGISSLPQSQLLVLKKLSRYCQIHLFFTNPSQAFWGDDREERIIEKLALKQQLSVGEVDELLELQGNPLLTTWGKQGKEFLNLLVEQEPKEISFYDEFSSQPKSLLTQVKQAILNSEFRSEFERAESDKSIQLHACHSKMREVEVLHNQLLALFEENPQLSPKDIIVMSPDIDGYAPYINAVFSVYDRHDPRFIPFALSDQKISYVEPIIASFLSLLAIKERQFTVDEIFDLFDVQAIREKYQLSESQLAQLKTWVYSAGVRSGLTKQESEWQNYNSWENGLNRLLLGISLKAENNAWQEIVAFDESYGLTAELTGYLAQFIENLTAWVSFIQQPQPLADWQTALNRLVSEFYQENEQSLDALLQLSAAIEQMATQISQSHFEQVIDVQVIAQIFNQQFSEQRSNLNFLVGKVNFCTLLPMRAIPFKVVCLLGMNEGDFPRQQTVNSFDLMQYATQKGDRAKRDDDRYLFLEALLAAQEVLYISYIGQSLTENSQKLPSILVSQLTEYIEERLTPAQPFQPELHPMTVFSPNNFRSGRKAYDKEWLAAKLSQAAPQPFLSHLARDGGELPQRVELSDLIAYLQAPVEFYFNRHLGIYFNKQNTALETAEPFALSNLEQFGLLDKLVDVDLNDTSTFFKNAKLCGNLPRCHFADLAQAELESNIHALQQAVKPYLAQTPEMIAIDCQLALGEQSIQLQGDIACFGDEVVQWRVGKLRDKDIIQLWIQYLALAASNLNISRFAFYYRDGDDAKTLSFSPISADDAKQLLARYLQDYFASYTKLAWAITENIETYLKPKKTSDEEQCQTALQNSRSQYIQRLLATSDVLEYSKIHQRTMDWFSPMIAHLQKDSL